MIGIQEIYEIACCIKELVEENDELKCENQRLRQIEKEYRDFLSNQLTKYNELTGNIIRKAFTKPYD